MVGEEGDEYRITRSSGSDAKFHQLQRDLRLVSPTPCPSIIHSQNKCTASWETKKCSKPPLGLENETEKSQIINERKVGGK